MSSVAGENQTDWNHSTVPVKVLVLSVVGFFFTVNFIVWCCVRYGFRIAAANSTDACNSNVATDTGIMQESLASLPTVVYSGAEHRDKLECAICLMELMEGEEGRLLPLCLHSFHADCIDMWLLSHSTCPLCRSTVEAVAQDSNQLPV